MLNWLNIYSHKNMRRPSFLSPGFTMRSVAERRARYCHGELSVRPSVCDVGEL